MREKQNSPSRLSGKGRKDLRQSLRKRILSNFCALSGVQMANMLLPLLTLPYLMRVLGPDKIGKIAIAQAFSQYFVLLTDYGFGFSAARKIAIIRGDPVETGVCYSQIVMAKLLLAMLGFTVFCGVVAIVPSFREDWTLHLFSYGTVLVSVLFPPWFFQGLERLHGVAILNLCSRGIFTVAILTFVRSASDYCRVPLIMAIGGIVAGLISQALIFGPMKIPFVLPSVSGVRKEFRDAFPHFLSVTSLGLYSASSVFILGLFATSAQVGYYSAAERLSGVVLRVTSCLSASLYPAMSQIASESRTRAKNALKSVVAYSVPPLLVIALVLCFFAPRILPILLGDAFEESVFLLRILAILPLLRSLTNLISVQGFYAFGKPTALVVIVFPLCLLHMCIGSLLSLELKHVGMALAVVLSDTMICVCCMVRFFKTTQDSPSITEPPASRIIRLPFLKKPSASIG